MDYRPPQQTVVARVFSGAGWLDATFHLAKRHNFSEFLSHHTWYPLTEVVIGKVGSLAFLELARDETLLVAPQVALPQLISEEHGTRKVTLLFPGGSIDGKLDLLHHVRLSDFVAHTSGFVELREANVRIWSDATAHQFDSVFVNPMRLVGASESEPTQ